MLPECEADERWHLMDDGSAPHVADDRRQYPGATLRETSAFTAKFSTATGAGFDGNGNFIPFMIPELKFSCPPELLNSRISSYVVA